MELSEGASEPGTNVPAVPAVPAGEESAVLQRGGTASKEERWVLCSERWLTSALGKTPGLQAEPEMETGTDLH